MKILIQRQLQRDSDENMIDEFSNNVLRMGNLLEYVYYIPYQCNYKAA
jgi:hypothetical protein